MKPLGSPAWSCGFHLHGDANVAEALEETLGELFPVALIEVLVAEVVVFDTIQKHEIDRGLERQRQAPYSDSVEHRESHHPAAEPGL